MGIKYWDELFTYRKQFQSQPPSVSVSKKISCNHLTLIHSADSLFFRHYPGDNVPICFIMYPFFHNALSYDSTPTCVTMHYVFCINKPCNWHNIFVPVLIIYGEISSSISKCHNISLKYARDILCYYVLL